MKVVANSWFTLSIGSLILAVGVASAQDQFTGCLTGGGFLVKVAAGDAPAKPCSENQTQISWNAEGPKGDQGDEGDMGPQGLTGPQGNVGPQGAQGPTGPKGDPGNAEPSFEVVGITATDFHGGAGIMRYNRDCRQQYSGSRMCTSLEVMQSALVEPGIYGWIRPTIVGVDAQGRIFDASGISAAPDETLTCVGWFNYSQYNSGLALANHLGSIRKVSCNVSQPTVCCAPAAADSSP